MGKTTKITLYATYIICTTLFFLYYLFPSEVARGYILSSLNRAAPEYDIRIGDLEPAFPPGVSLSNVSVFHKDETILDSDKIEVSPGILPLFTGRIAVDIDCDAYGGSIDARIDFSGQKPFFTAAAVKLATLQIGDILLLKTRIPHNLSGVLSGNINYESGKDKKNSVTADIILAEGGIEFLSPFHGLESLHLQKIEADIEINRNKVNVNRFINQGGDMDGSLSGSIAVRKNFQKSVLNLKGSLHPHPVFIEKLGRLGPIAKGFMKSKGDENGDIPVNIQGTFEKPRLF